MHEHHARDHQLIVVLHAFAVAVNFLDQYQEQFPFDRIVADWFSLRDIASAITAAQDPAVIRVGVIP